jgi:hypothetical protein
MMSPNHSNFASRDDGTLDLPGSDKGSPREDHFTERIRAFEQCCTSGSTGIRNFLRLAAADLFHSIPLVEGAVVDELKEAFENPLVHKRPAFRRYMRTLQVLRKSLWASVALETQAQPNAMTFQSQKTKRDQS